MSNDSTAGAVEWALLPYAMLPRNPMVAFSADAIRPGGSPAPAVLKIVVRATSLGQLDFSVSKKKITEGAGGVNIVRGHVRGDQRA